MNNELLESILNALPYGLFSVIEIILSNISTKSQNNIMENASISETVFSIVIIRNLKRKF